MQDLEANLGVDSIIQLHNFTKEEQWLVIFLTFITALSFLAVVVVLFKLHRKRGLDIVLIIVSSLCFIIYRCSIAFRLTNAKSTDYVFLPT